MGLDNGVYLRFKDKDVAIKVKEYMERVSDNKVYMYDNEENENKTYDVELLYWRKCWNIRDIFFTIVKEDSGKVEYKLTADDLENASKRLVARLTPKSWNKDYDNGRTIWSFEECGGGYLGDLEIAWRVMGYIEGLKFAYDKFRIGTNPEVEYVFYDSY